MSLMERKRRAAALADRYFAEQCERLGPISRPAVGMIAHMPETDRAAHVAALFSLISGREPINLRSFAPKDEAGIEAKPPVPYFHASDMFPPGHGMKMAPPATQLFRL